MEYKWVHSSVYSSIPPFAVVGGNDSDGSMMYVGRSYHNGDMLVAKVLPTKHAAFVSWRGEEVPKEHFEVLCGQNLVWQHCYDHVIPENAISCGETSIGQPVYVGRGYFEGSLTVGKVSSVHRALFIPYGGSERRLETYELLVNENKPFGWDVPYSPPPPPPPPHVYEKPPMYTPIPELDTKPSMYPPSSSAPSMYPQPPPYPPIMPPPPPPGASMNFPPPYPPTMPPPPPPGASTDLPPPYVTPATVYTPSHGHGAPPPPPQPHYPHTGSHYRPPPHHHPHHPSHHSADMWMPVTGNALPSNAVQAGLDVDQSSIFVCRAFHEGDLIPGKYIPKHSCAYIPYSGQEISKHNWEVLVGGEKYHWVPASNGSVAPGAVSAGRTRNGETLYVGRGHYNGSLTPGKIQQSHQCLYIPFGGGERRISNYEVLVRRNDYYREHTMKMHY